MATRARPSKKVAILEVVVVGTSSQTLHCLLGLSSADAESQQDDIDGDDGVVVEYDFMEGNYAFHYSTVPGPPSSHGVNALLESADAVVVVYDNDQPDEVRSDLRKLWIPALNEGVSEEVGYFLLEINAPDSSETDTEKFGLSIDDVPTCDEVHKLFDSLPSDMKTFIRVNESAKVEKLQTFAENLFLDAKVGRKRKNKKCIRWCVLS